MIGPDKDFFKGKFCVKWKDSEFEEQVWIKNLIPRGDASNRLQPSRDGGSSRAPKEVDKHPQEVLILCLVT